MREMASIRQSSWEIAAGLGFPKNDALPLMDTVNICRSVDDVVNRIFGMLCAGASAYGLDRKKALAWLEREGNVHLLARSEWEFLNGAQMNAVPFMEQIEGIWALCWRSRIVPELDFSKPCSADFVKLLPDLKKDETGAAFRRKASLRDPQEVVAKCDLAYCLHWAVVHAGLTGKLKKGIKAYVIIERRRALDWMLSDELWDELALDT
jgi:hypothetical protein